MLPPYLIVLPSAQISKIVQYERFYLSITNSTILVFYTLTLKMLDLKISQGKVLEIPVKFLFGMVAAEWCTEAKKLLIISPMAHVKFALI